MWDSKHYLYNVKLGTEIPDPLCTRANDGLYQISKFCVEPDFATSGKGYIHSYSIVVISDVYT